MPQTSNSFLRGNSVPSAPPARQMTGYYAPLTNSERRIVNDFNDAVKDAEATLQRPPKPTNIIHNIWSGLCGTGWFVTLCISIYLLFQDNTNNDWLWGVFVSLLCTLVIPFEMWAIRNWKFLSWFNTKEWLFVIRIFFILSTVFTTVFLGVSLSRARVLNKTEQWDWIQVANLAYIVSAVAGHEMRPIVREEDEGTFMWKIIKILFIGVATLSLLIVNGNHDVNYKTEKEDWVFTGSLMSLGVYGVGAGIRDWVIREESEILRIFIVTSSAIALLGTSFLVGLYLDEDFRTANTLEYNASYMWAFSAVLVSLVCDHLKHKVNKIM